MTDLTPIPTEQRRAYYDALLAGRAEAQRLGYGLMDDRIFAAFHRALYGPMLAAHEAQVRAKVADELAALQPPDRAELPQWFDGYREALRVAVAVTRAHAFEGPSVAVEPRTPTPESDRTYNTAETRTGRSDEDTRDDRQEP